MSKFRKKPVVIEAVQFTLENKERVFVLLNCPAILHSEKNNPIIKIKTLEGVMSARLGDWIIKGVKGEFYPCKPDVFEATYEEVGE